MCMSIHIRIYSIYYTCYKPTELVDPLPALIVDGVNVGHDVVVDLDND